MHLAKFIEELKLAHYHLCSLAHCRRPGFSSRCFPHLLGLLLIVFEMPKNSSVIPSSNSYCVRAITSFRTLRYSLFVLCTNTSLLHSLAIDIPRTLTV